MKVLFLDVDGVLNCRQTFIDTKGMDPLDPHMVERAQKIVRETGCKVILSSSWRHHKDLKQKIHTLIPLYDCTQDSPSGFRGLEIRDWLWSHADVEHYAILDDDSDFYEDQWLFKTDFNTGLTEDITSLIIQYLNNKRLCR